MRTARKLAFVLSAAGLVTMLGSPAVRASAPAGPSSVDAAVAAKRPTHGECTVWANYKRPDIGALSVDGRLWDNFARRHGFPVDGRARAGDIAVWEAGQLGAFSMGHVAFVIKVRKNGRVDVSEFNWGAARERLGVRRNVRATGLKFIHRKRR